MTQLSNTRESRVYLLGEFCLQLAITESLLHQTVQRLSNMDTKVFQATHSGLRIEGSMSLISRLLEAAGKDPQKTPYHEMFEHLRWLLEVRNTVLHYGLTFGEETNDIVATNARIALRESSEKTILFSVDVLESLLSDLHKLNAHLAVEINPKLLNSGIEQTLRVPWRYKPDAAKPRVPQ